MSVDRFRSYYEDEDEIRRQVDAGLHRDAIGGLWDEMGNLQLDFAVARGLKPHHKLIDIGCGSFRGGVKFINYLVPGNYFGVDVSAPIVDAGYEREIIPAGLHEKFPRHRVHINNEFAIGGFGQKFDFGVAQSVFSHLPLGELSVCLTAIAPHFAVDGQFMSTCFLAPDAEVDKPFKQGRMGPTSYPDRDPFHYSIEQILDLASQHPEWVLDVVGEWDHPRDQKMLVWTKQA